MDVLHEKRAFEIIAETLVSASVTYGLQNARDLFALTGHLVDLTNRWATLDPFDKIRLYYDIHRIDLYLSRDDLKILTLQSTENELLGYEITLLSDLLAWGKLYQLVKIKFSEALSEQTLRNLNLVLQRLQGKPRMTSNSLPAAIIPSLAYFHQIHVRLEDLKTSEATLTSICRADSIALLPRLELEFLFPIPDNHGKAAFIVSEILFKLCIQVPLFIF